jgi:hypothetical protein
MIKLAMRYVHYLSLTILIHFFPVVPHLPPEFLGYLVIYYCYYSEVY